MALWLYLVGGLQAGYGTEVDGYDSLDCGHLLNSSYLGPRAWVIQGHHGVTIAIIVFTYFFVCSFAVTWGPCSWTYPSGTLLILSRIRKCD
jgi:hypothetical protein